MKIEENIDFKVYYTDGSEIQGGMVQLWSIIQKSDQPTWAFTCDTSAPLLIFLKDENWTTFVI